MELRDKRLFIGIPNSQPVIPSSFFWSFISIKKPCQTFVQRTDNPDSCMRNNRLLELFLESGYDYYVQMDTDESYPPDYLTTMVPLIDEYKVIAAMIYDRMRGNKYRPLLFSKVDPISLRPSAYLDIEGKSGIIEVPYLHATVFMAREVVEKLKKPWFKLYFSEDGLSKIKHTDIAFSEKIKEAGYKLYVNLDVDRSHLTELAVNRGTHGI